MFYHLLQQGHIRVESRLCLLPSLNGHFAGVLGSLAVTKGFGTVAVSGKQVAIESEADTKHQVAKYSNDGERKHCLLTEQKGDRDKGVHRATASPG